MSLANLALASFGLIAATFCPIQAFADTAAPPTTTAQAAGAAVEQTAADRAENVIDTKNILPPASETADTDTALSTVERLLQSISLMVTVIGGLLLIFAVGAGVLLGRSLSDLRRELEEATRRTVVGELQGEGEAGKNFKALHASLQASIAEYKEDLDRLALIRARAASEDDDLDPAYALEILNHENKDRMSHHPGGRREPMPLEQRNRVRKLLEIIIDRGCYGTVDPNVLFNAAAVAGNLDLDDECAKIAALAYHFKPEPSNAMFIADNLTDFGTAYVLEFDGNADSDGSTKGRLVRDGNPLEDQRTRAEWIMLTEVLKRPRLMCEHVYQKAFNIALKRAERSGYDPLINSILASTHPEAAPYLNGLPRTPESHAESLSALTSWVASKTATWRPSVLAGEILPELEPYVDLLPSYAYSILCDLTALSNSTEWRKELRFFRSMALRRLSMESPRTTWRAVTVQNLVVGAIRDGDKAKLADLLKSFDAIGIDYQDMSASISI